MKIDIAFLHWSRDFIKVLLRELNKLSVAHQRQIRLNVLTNIHKDGDEAERYKPFVDAYLNPNIERRVLGFPYGINYIKKVRWVCDQGADYCLKYDEDTFINHHYLAWMIDNAEQLDDPKNLLLAPALSIGVPTVEMWAESFLTEAEREELYRIFLRTHIRDRWNMPFEELNAYTTGAQHWDGEGFYRAVGAIPGGGYYRGIHPVRISYEAQHYMAERVIVHAKDFCAPQEYRVVAKQYPYFCNSLFLIKTLTWRKIVTDESLFRDSFDEVPINLYRKQHGLNWLFVPNAFGVHVMYRSVEDKRINELERSFYPNFERVTSGLAFDIA